MMVHTAIQQAIAEHKLPPSFTRTVSHWYVPIARDVASRAKQSDRTLILGIQGTQGSGKSTMADFMRLLLVHDFGLRVATVSIDDFYLTAADRQQLSENIHPLLRTRGVPGTHDIPLAFSTLEQLRALASDDIYALPRFNKAIDDRMPEDQWPSVSGPLDVVIFEGWCLAAPPQPDSALADPINDLERHEDPDGAWRRYVNQQLAGDYARLFGQLDCLAVLTAPGFECVREWRNLQEAKLAESLKNAPPEQKACLQTPAQLERFIAHYERVTCHCLEQLPAKADWVLSLDRDHSITDLRFREETA